MNKDKVKKFHVKGEYIENKVKEFNALSQWLDDNGIPEIIYSKNGWQVLSLQARVIYFITLKSNPLCAE